MRETTRNFSHLGAYVFGTALLFSSFALAAPIVLKEFADTPFVSWTAAVLEPAPKEPTRLSVAVTNAREIRAALAKPIPGPDPLPPITAKLAYGLLKPGGKGVVTGNKFRLPQVADDAMAMDLAAPKQHRARSAVLPELHKVY